MMIIMKSKLVKFIGLARGTDNEVKSKEDQWSQAKICPGYVGQEFKCNSKTKSFKIGMKEEPTLM